MRQPRWELRNILAPIDFSETSKKALSYALSFAKQNGARITLLHVNVFRTRRNAAIRPVTRNGNLPLVPGGGEAAAVLCPPARIGEHRLAVLLHVIGDARPATRDLEPAPLPGGHLSRPSLGRLLLPQAVQADALAGRRGLAIRLAHVPNGLQAWRQGQCQILRAASERRRRHYA